ncbi:glutaminyl-peptide cyclotransferase-like a [Cyprinodon tularosa]|uniref:glutaminyl-peptide cyclotransferase-like a n=1 Tax=Cyprinodon tularosa TaxID=77115 RepID=UPI0018E20475|nr:glutaminyl-peptide cyclotransferase-like a [Cyprinodon tularosa]XP_038162326.1 glutaminyl-peptide cyclotransferase-like a [Cyprinodon tularosa]
MPRSSRRNNKTLPQSNGGGSLPGCERGRILRARVLIVGLLGVLVLAVVLSVYLVNDTSSGHVSRLPAVDLVKDRLSHKPSKASAAQIRRLASLVDSARLWETHLQPILIERLPGTRGSLAVQQHIASTLSSLSAGWAIDLDSFQSPTPRGQVTFTNVIAVLDPTAPRRLLLACHYDSKILPPDPQAPGKMFLGASDSAVPCAMILELAASLDTQLKSFKQQKLPVTLQLVFFDGEESFEEWTDTDSLYGSRHLAELMAKTPHPAASPQATTLQAVDLFVLLDLLGGPDPLIANHFDNTARWFDRLISAEKRLHRLGLLVSHPSEQTYFRKDVYLGPVQDDHIPFLHRGVPVLHIIPTPFPQFWHTLDDTEENMHHPTVENLTKIMAVFLAEYLGL